MPLTSSAARLLLRNGKSVAAQLFRGRPANLADAAQNVGAARSLLLFNQTRMDQFPVFSDPLPVLQSGFWAGSVLGEKEGVVRDADRLGRGTMEAARGKRVIGDEDDDAGDDGGFDDVDIDDMDDFDDDDDEDFDDDHDVDDDDDEDDEKYIRKRN